jgi:uncharacterized membrane protein YjfL (UPF0719 family)
MKNLKTLFVVVFLILGVFVYYNYGLANTTETVCEDNCPISLKNPLTGIETPQALIGQIINSLFGIIGSLALVMFVYGGLLWMTSSGSAEQVKKGKDIFIWAVVGLVVVFSAYSLVRFVIQGVGG